MSTYAQQRPPSTAMLTVTWILSLILGLGYIGLFVLMGLSASDEITTIERLQDMKRGGAQITNTDADLAAMIEDNELAIVVFFVGAAVTLPLVVASACGRLARAWTRALATAFLLPPIAVIVFGVIHDLKNGHEGNEYALVFTVPAIVLGILWWLPATGRAMAARRWRRAPVQQGPPPPPPVPGWAPGPYR